MNCFNCGNLVPLANVFIQLACAIDYERACGRTFNTDASNFIVYCSDEYELEDCGCA